MDLKKYLFPFGVKPRREQGDGPQYADLYERGMAAAVDVTLLFYIFRNLFQYISTALYQHADPEKVAQVHEANDGMTMLHLAIQAGLPQLWLLNAVIQIWLMGVLYLGFQLSYRTTPGKWLFGLRIVRVGSHEEPKRWQYFLRYFAYIPAAPLFFLLSFNKQHRGLHDRIAGTVVLHTRPRGWYVAQVKRGYRWVRGKLAAPVE